MKKSPGAYGCTGVFFMKKWIIGICILSAAAICAELAVLASAVSRIPNLETAALPGEAAIVIRNGDPDSKQLALTCNVDWGEDVLPELLEILREKKAPVTFFVTGQWAGKHPDLVRRMYLEGHDVQSHGYSHKLCSRISAEEVREEMTRTEAAISDILGYKVTVFAPPSGDYNEETLKLCREFGYTLSLWSADTIDWKPGSTADVIRQRILKKPLSGAIVLMHPKEETARALPGLIDAIRKRGIEIVPLENFICRKSEKGV